MEQVFPRELHFLIRKFLQTVKLEHLVLAGRERREGKENVRVRGGMGLQTLRANYLLISASFLLKSGSIRIIPKKGMASEIVRGGKEQAPKGV